MTEDGLGCGQGPQGVPEHEWFVRLVRQLDGGTRPRDGRRRVACPELDPGQVPEDQPSDVSVLTDLLEGLQEQPLHAREVVPAHERDGVHRLRPSGTGRRVGEHLLVELAGATRITSREEGLRRPEASQQESLALLSRGDRGCQPGELGGGERSTPRHGVLSRLLEGTGDLLARYGRAERQVPRPFLRLLDHLRECSVCGASVAR